MTRKESGWVEEAMRMLRKYGDANYAEGTADAYEDLRISLKRNAEVKELRNAIRLHFTSLQSAAEGLEEALTKCRDELELLRHDHFFEFVDFRSIDAALAAFQAIKERQQ